MNRVWIELERPTSEQGDEVGQQRADLANKMMRKLGATHDLFYWWAKERKYSHTVSAETGAFVWLTDNGEWFDLEVLTK